MYAIFEDGGRQYRVAQGDMVYVDPRELQPGQETIEFDRVLLVGDGAQARIGQPLVEGAKVIARVNGQIKGEKVHIIKFRRRKDYYRKTGHRQKHLQVTISEIVS